MGPPAAAADPRDPDARADGVRVRRTEALRSRLDLYGPRPDPTAADGPDPYGDPEPEWLRIDWREHLGTITVPPASSAPRPGAGGSAEGTTVHYAELKPPRDKQASRALVFVHGLGGCWQNWLENIPHFAGRHRVIALDLPGFGSSPMPDWEISIPAYGRLLREFADALEIGDCVVVGNSMGGFVAAEAVITQPDRFEKLVLVSAAGVSSARLRRQPTEVVARMLAVAVPYAMNLERRSFRRPRARATAFGNLVRYPGGLRPELLWELFAGGMRAQAFAEALGSLAGYDFLDRLEEVEVPTLITWGRADNVVPPADALEYGRLLNNSRTVIFDETGHLPMAERPVRFNRLLGQFLAE
ncbi:MAG: alpha/beta fold hydrolase [Solirubrobacterales bacterium]|nr:alpha/beta fold hydrolase [Solirubrobacterales bacterium]